MQVWQIRDLREGVFGSVAMIGVTGGISEVWQMQELATFCRKTGVEERGVRRTARRARMGLSGAGYRQSRAGLEEPYYTIFGCLSRRK